MAEMQSGDELVLINETRSPEKGYMLHRDGMTEFLWENVEEKEDCDTVIIKDATIYPGIHSVGYVREDDLLSMVDEDYRPKMENMINNEMNKFTRLNIVDRFISECLRRLTFGAFELTQPLFTPIRIYLAPGFYDFGFYTEWDEVAVPMEDWFRIREENADNSVSVDRIDMIHHNRNLEKKELNVFDDEDENQGET